MPAAVLPRDHFPPKRMPSFGSALTAIQEKPSAVKPESGTKSLPTKTSTPNTIRRTSNSRLPPVNLPPKRDYGGPKSPRRDSVNSVSSSISESSRRSSSIRRTSFRTIGSRVTGLIRAKNAFRRIKKRPETEENEEIEDDVYIIQEMPKYPRFASTLSAEAQYATLLGYEDIVYDRLTVSYPEYRSLLRRNHTPNTGVEVTGELPIKQLKKVEINAVKQTPSKPDAFDGKTDLYDDKADSKNILESPSSDISESPRSKEKKPRRISPFKASFQTSSTQSTSSKAFSNTLTLPTFGRSRSLPQLVPENKQLVMTHRYQKAMDIYDVLRKSDGVNVLSPRIKGLGGNGDPPIKEFNSWSMVWKREFRSKTRLPSA